MKRTSLIYVIALSFSGRENRQETGTPFCFLKLIHYTTIHNSFTCTPLHVLPNKTTTAVKPLSSFIRSALNESQKHEPERSVRPKHISTRPEAKKPKLSERYSIYAGQVVFHDMYV